MAEEEQQIHLPSLVIILVLSGLIFRYLFFSPSPNSANNNAARGRQAADPAAIMRSREQAVERIQQMFPQVDRRTILWDLQRTGGNIAVTTERVLQGRLESPPVTFQPPPPPTSTTNRQNGNQASTSKASAAPSQPDLITRYNLKDKVNAVPVEEPEEKTGKKAWSSNRDERQSLLQKRRDQMILEARRKMEAKIKAEKEAKEKATTSS
ncbi:hypothetical protein QBC42DRAFT_198384 [Cladorrhinum samala]|uniref:Coupling of ubiquitin conjugation to ER degradation protein 1 n=1 Tax=Cladorrhinum samala TaxID=585594 RepID=A0AAV9HVI4_9PEZI|nr:hypothetical protein QBC42DRAFT_198384 [Cladorrhinum samala]